MSNQERAGAAGEGEAATALAKGEGKGRESRDRRPDSDEVPGIVVIVREGETSFPVGDYARILDKSGSAAHTLRTVSFFPGLNLTAKITIDRRREQLDAESWAKINRHPEFKRIRDQHRVRTYSRLADVPIPDRVQFAALTVDWLVLEAWAAAETVKQVKVAIAEQMETLRRQGRDRDDSHVPEVQTTQGHAATF